MSTNPDVLEERISEAMRDIDRLRKHSHDLTNGFFVMSETLKNVNRDMEKLFYVTSKLNDKIEKFRVSFLNKIHNVELQNKDIVVEKRVWMKILKSVFSCPKHIMKLIFVGSALFVAFQTKNFGELFKHIYHWFI